MTSRPDVPGGTAATDRAAPTAPAVDSTALLQGRREVPIRHGADTYRLRLTASNKLILTK